GVAGAAPSAAHHSAAAPLLGRGHRGPLRAPRGLSLSPTTPIPCDTHRSIWGHPRMISLSSTAPVPCDTPGSILGGHPGVQSPPLFPHGSHHWVPTCSFVVGSDGYLYEGRGWHWVSAHTKDYNTKGFSTGIFQDFLPDFILCGQLSPINCPGNTLFQEIQSWPSFQGTLVSTGLGVGVPVGLVGGGLG
uniref:Uncharacterized protein n=1 Tax=Junco hyemalis TaxID=40217 RepID=A0A8C5IDK3_JUNHY